MSSDSEWDLEDDSPVEPDDINEFKIRFEQELLVFFFKTKCNNIFLHHFRYTLTNEDLNNQQKVMYNFIENIITSKLTYFSLIIPNKLENKFFFDFFIGLSEENQTIFIKKFKIIKLIHIGELDYHSIAKTVMGLFEKRYSLDHRLDTKNPRKTINTKFFVHDDSLYNYYEPIEDLLFLFHQVNVDHGIFDEPDDGMWYFHELFLKKKNLKERTQKKLIDKEMNYKKK